MPIGRRYPRRAIRAEETIVPSQEPINCAGKKAPAWLSLRPQRAMSTGRIGPRITVTTTLTAKPTKSSVVMLRVFCASDWVPEFLFAPELSFEPELSVASGVLRELASEVSCGVVAAAPTVLVSGSVMYESISRRARPPEVFSRGREYRRGQKPRFRPPEV